MLLLLLVPLHAQNLCTAAGTASVCTTASTAPVCTAASAAPVCTAASAAPVCTAASAAPIYYRLQSQDHLVISHCSCNTLFSKDG